MSLETNPALTPDQQIRADLRIAINLMRGEAAKVGPLHSWWDVIFDFEQHLAQANGPTRQEGQAQPQPTPEWYPPFET